MTGEDYESDFEYDGEDIETEGVEADDETLEAAGEDLESDIESEDMEDVEDVEAESLDEDVESDIEAEAFGESDIEMDESLDEAAVSASARLRASQDRSRRVAFARQVAAGRKVEAKRAASTQRAIATQLKTIQPGAPAKVYSVGSLQGAGVVTAILPNGRRSRMRIIPTLAPVSEVNRLRTVVLTNEKRQAVATAKNSRAITRLASTQAGVVKRLTAQQMKSDQEISKRIVEGHNRLDARITKELSAGSGVVGKHGKRMLRALKRQRQRSLWNSVLLATSAPFFSAYGERSDPFARNNLILTGSLVGWMVGDELIDYFAGKSSGMRSAADMWSYLAPVGNGATAYFLLNKGQHERFLSDVTDVPAAGAITIDLTKRLGADAVEDFKKGTHAVVASFVGGAGAIGANSVIGSVDNAGILTLSVNPAAAAQVAWVVDTQATA